MWKCQVLYDLTMTFTADVLLALATPKEFMIRMSRTLSHFHMRVRDKLIYDLTMTFPVDVMLALAKM